MKHFQARPDTIQKAIDRTKEHAFHMPNKEREELARSLSGGSANSGFKVYLKDEAKYTLAKLEALL
jgi:hypothetical protein